MTNYSTVQWSMLFFCGFIAGVSKSGIPGAGILNVPLMALTFPAKMSTGLLLPLLAGADVFAVAYYRRHANWGCILKLLPWALLGIAVGSVAIRYIDDFLLKPLIGVIIMSMLCLNFWRQYKTALPEIPSHWLFAAVMGFIAGLTTQLANAAGPVMVIYLLAMKLPKESFIGTGAWYALILNWLKIPLFMMDGRIDTCSLQAALMALPFIFAGAAVGILLLKKIPQRWFNITVQILALAAALKLLI